MGQGDSLEGHTQVRLMSCGRKEAILYSVPPGKRAQEPSKQAGLKLLAGAGRRRPWGEQAKLLAVGLGLLQGAGLPHLHGV